MNQRADRAETPTTAGRGVATRPIRFDTFAGGRAAKEFRPMDPCFPLAFDAPRPADHRVRHRRLTPQERAAMLPHPNLIHNLAELHQVELHREAEQHRLLRAMRAQAADGRLANLRRAVGAALVRAGVRVQGVERSNLKPANGDLGHIAGHLRIVR